MDFIIVNYGATITRSGMSNISITNTEVFIFYFEMYLIFPSLINCLKFRFSYVVGLDHLWNAACVSKSHVSAREIKIQTGLLFASIPAIGKGARRGGGGGFGGPPSSASKPLMIRPPKYTE